MKNVGRLSMGAVKQRLRHEAMEYAQNQKGVTRCAECRWKFRGSFRDGRQAFATHRELKHS